jgi:hypothetical protein
MVSQLIAGAAQQRPELLAVAGPDGAGVLSLDRQHQLHSHQDQRQARAGRSVIERVSSSTVSWLQRR